MAVYFDTLESRCLLSGGPHGSTLTGFGFRLHIPANPSPAVQADLDKIKTDQAQLKTDRTNLADTLKTDRQGINDAINALSGQLDPLRTQLQNDASSWHDVLAADRSAIKADKDAGNTTQLATDQAKLKADRTAANAALKADGDSIRSVIDNDPAVQAARDKFKTDSQPITDDLNTLTTDFKQLRTDILAQNGGSSSGSTRGGSTTSRA
jgi:chromosome segregation ATPase